MKNPMLLLLALVAFGCSSPEPTDLSTLVHQDGQYLDSDTMEPYSGVVISFFGADPVKIAQSATLKNGYFDGPYQEYHKNGQLWLKGTYSAGQLDGPGESYRESGELWSRGNFSNGKFDGSWEFYSEEGQLLDKGSFKNGEQCGEWMEGGETVTYDPCPSN